MKPKSDIWQTVFYKTLCGGILISCCLLTACKSTTGVVGSGAEIMKSEEIFFASLLDRSFRFHTLSARLKLELNSPGKEISVRAQLKMICDDRLQLSIQPLLGIEAFRIEVTNDSVKILDRMNKCFITESYEKIKGKSAFDFNFHNLQSLFANNIFIPGESGISPGRLRRFRMSKNKDSAILKIKDESGMMYIFTADGDEKLLSTSILDRSGNNSLIWDYDDFQNVGKQRFPFRMEARLTADDRTQSLVTLTFSTPEINSPLNTDFSIPSGYKQVPFSQIIKLLDKQ
ncbi:MAG: DUF4292 domain-containing protein [Tannerella sp.]|jgi:hypothetical protein|nr:DUF4292 domain-containing protein [Tannerella sp.]